MLDNVQSGVGSEYNTFTLDKPERTVVSALFRLFPRNLLSGRMTVLPRSPWIVSDRRQSVIGKLLTRFRCRPSFLNPTRIFLDAMGG